MTENIRQSYIDERTAYPYPTPEEFFEDVTMTPNEVEKVLSDSLEELSKFMSVKDAKTSQMVMSYCFAFFLQDKSKTRSVYKSFNSKDFCNKVLDK
jgi:hypothetical protein